MQRLLTRFGVLLLAVVLVAVVASGQTTVLNFFDQPDSGGDNTFNLNGTWEVGDVAVAATAEMLNTVAVGVASGYKVARGQATLDGSNPTSAATGLTTVAQCVATLEGTASPALDPLIVTTTITATNLDISAWKPTAAGDVTLIASTNATDVVSWICVGT